MCLQYIKKIWLLDIKAFCCPEPMRRHVRFRGKNTEIKDTLFTGGSNFTMSLPDFKTSCLTVSWKNSGGLRPASCSGWADLWAHFDRIKDQAMINLAPWGGSWISPENKYFVNDCSWFTYEWGQNEIILSGPYFLIPAAMKRNSREVLVETLLGTSDPAMSPPGN